MEILWFVIGLFCITLGSALTAVSVFLLMMPVYTDRGAGKKILLFGALFILAGTGVFRLTA